MSFVIFLWLLNHPNKETIFKYKRKKNDYFIQYFSEDISRLFVWSRGLCGAGPDAQASLRRASSIRRTLTTGKYIYFLQLYLHCFYLLLIFNIVLGAVVVNRRSMVAHIQNGVEGVLGTLRRSRPLFIFCALAKKSQTEKMITTKDNEIPLDVQLLRSQVNY